MRRKSKVLEEAIENHDRFMQQAEILLNSFDELHTNTAQDLPLEYINRDALIEALDLSEFVPNYYVNAIKGQAFITLNKELQKSISSLTFDQRSQLVCKNNVLNSINTLSMIDDLDKLYETSKIERNNLEIRLDKERSIEPNAFLFILLQAKVFVLKHSMKAYSEFKSFSTTFQCLFLIGVFSLLLGDKFINLIRIIVE